MRSGKEKRTDTEDTKKKSRSPTALGVTNTAGTTKLTLLGEEELS